MPTAELIHSKSLSTLKTHVGTKGHLSYGDHEFLHHMATPPILLLQIISPAHYTSTNVEVWSEWQSLHRSGKVSPPSAQVNMDK